MKAIILGAGAVGIAYGEFFRSAGYDVSYLMSPTTHDAIKSSGNSFHVHLTDSIVLESSSPSIHSSIETLPKDADLIIITLKTTANDSLRESLPSLANDNTAVLVMQNGIGAEEEIQALLPNNPIIAAVVTIRALRTAEPGHVNVPIIGALKLAALKPEHQYVCDMIGNAFAAYSGTKPEVIISNSVKEIRYLKLLWNATFNTLSTLCRLSALPLSTEEPYKSFIETLMREIIKIAGRDSIIIPKDIIQTLLADTAKQGEYYPSMYLDLIAGRDIEVKYIVSNLLAIATQHGIKTPFLAYINSQLIFSPIPQLTAQNLQSELLKKQDLFCYFSGYSHGIIEITSVTQDDEKATIELTCYNRGEYKLSENEYIQLDGVPFQITSCWNQLFTATTTIELVKDTSLAQPKNGDMLNLGILAENDFTHTMLWMLQPSTKGIVVYTGWSNIKGHQHTLQLDFKAPEQLEDVIKGNIHLGLNGASLTAQNVTKEDGWTKFSIFCGQETREKTKFNERLPCNSKINLTEGAAVIKRL